MSKRISSTHLNKYNILDNVSNNNGNSLNHNNNNHNVSSVDYKKRVLKPLNNHKSAHKDKDKEK